MYTQTTDDTENSGEILSRFQFICKDVAQWNRRGRILMLREGEADVSASSAGETLSRRDHGELL